MKEELRQEAKKHLKERYKGITDEQIDKVLNEVDKMDLPENKIMFFITDCVNLFEYANDAFDWFISDNEISLVDIIMNEGIEVTEEMVGMNMGYAIVKGYLDIQENYIKVDNDIHMTWWL